MELKIKIIIKNRCQAHLFVLLGKLKGSISVVVRSISVLQQKTELKGQVNIAIRL